MLTNRSKVQAGGALPTEVGVDTIAIRATLNSQPPTRSLQDLTYNPAGPQRLGEQLPSGVWLTVVRSIRGWEARLEFSIPKFFRATNYPAATPEETSAAVAGLLTEASGVFDWVEDVDSWRVVRLDSVKDFKCPPNRIGTALTGLVSAPMRYRPLIRCWVSQDGEPESIEIGPRSRRGWKVRAYTKHGGGLERSGIGIPETVLRFELQMRTPVLRGCGIRDPLGLDWSVVRGVNERYFDRLDFGRSVGGLPKLREAGERAASDGQGKAFSRALAVLAAENWKVPSPYGDRTRRNLIRVARTYGIASSDLLGLSEETIRLEYGQGRMIVESQDE